MSQEQDNFQVKCVKASAARARKALMEISKLCKVRRQEIPRQKEPNVMTESSTHPTQPKEG